MSGDPVLEALADRTRAWQALAAALEAVETVEEARELLEVHSVAAELRQPVSGRRRGPVLAVTGDLKAGRSTLLNSLLGRERLATAVRPCTSHPVSVWGRGAWWTERPPTRRSEGAAARPADGRVLLVDVRQPLPRAVPLAACAGPTVVVCTKADRALEDAVLSEDPAEELALARRVARRRVAERVGEGAVWIDADPRDEADVQGRVWPLLRAALAPAWEAAQERRRQARAVAWEARLAGFRESCRPPLPETVPVSELAVELCRRELSLCLSALEGDLAAVEMRIRATVEHASLDAVGASLPALLAEAVLQATQAVTRDRQARWAGSVQAVDERVSAAWAAHLGLARTLLSGEAVPGGGAPGFGAELPVGDWKATAGALEGGPPGVFGRAARRLRRVETRRAALLERWRALADEVVQTLGDGAWQERWRVEEALAEVAADRMAWVAARCEGAEEAAERVDTARRQVADRLASLGKPGRPASDD